MCLCVCVRPFYFYFLRIVKEEETVLHGGDYMEGEVKATHHVTIPRPFSSSFFGIQPLRLLSSVTTSPVTHTHTQNFNTHTPNETKSQCITRMRRLRFIGLRVAVVASRRLQHRKKYYSDSACVIGVRVKQHVIVSDDNELEQKIQSTLTVWTCVCV